MKKIILASLFCLATSFAVAGPAGPPAGVFPSTGIANSSTLQVGATFNVSSATITNLYNTKINDRYAITGSSSQIIYGEPFDWSMKGIEFGQLGTGSDQSHWLWKYAVLKSSITGAVQVSKPLLNDVDQTLLITVDFAVAGLNGLAVGESKLSNTWYYGYLVGNGINVGGVWSVHCPTDTAKIAMPAGYTYFKYFASQLLDASSVTVRMVKVDDYVKFAIPQVIFSSSPAGIASYTTMQSLDVTSKLPQIVSWSVDILSYTGPKYNGSAGMKDRGISIGWDATNQALSCGGSYYQDGTANNDILCLTPNIPVFNEGGASPIQWKSSNTTAALTSWYVFIYIYGYHERNQ